MTNPNSPKPDVQCTEAGASWNTRYITHDGFECQLTLRGETGQEVLERAIGAIAFLLKSNCTPYTYTKNNNHKANYADQAQSNNHQEQQNGNAHNPDGNGNNRSWCPIHQVEMKKWEKDGRVWYSHKSGDAWCTGKPKSK